MKKKRKTKKLKKKQKGRRGRSQFWKKKTCKKKGTKAKKKTCWESYSVFPTRFRVIDNWQFTAVINNKNN